MNPFSKYLINPFFLALSLLTRIPSPKISLNDSVWSFSPAFFPFCAYIASLFSSISFIPLFLLLIASALPPGREITCILTPVIYLSASIWINRAFHLDGFCDTLDAYSAMSADKEKRLQIMKDPHPGSSAVAGLTLLLLLKSASLYIILKLYIYQDTYQALKQIVLLLASITALSRVNTTLLAYFAKYPRQSGTAEKIIGRTSSIALIISVISAIILSYPAFTVRQIWLLAITYYFICIIINFLYWLASSHFKLGGATGDILGACTETTETSLFLLSAVMLPIIS